MVQVSGQNTNMVKEKREDNGSQVPNLIKKLHEDFKSITGDRGHDRRTIWEAIEGRKQVIHPRKDAVLSGKKEWIVREHHVH